MKTLAVIQHDSSEHLGLIEDHLEGRQIRFRYFRPFTSGGRLPSFEATADGLVLLGGGPWGAMPEPRPLPTLEAEVALVDSVLAADRPVIGIGLGAIILALAGGGGAAPAPLTFEVGAAIRTASDALAGFLPARYPVVRYGRDEMIPPPQARTLARDEAGRPALFQLGGRAFGFAGHPGIKSAMIEDLIMEFPEAPDDPEPGLRALRCERAAVESSLVSIMTGLVRCTGLMDEFKEPGTPSR